MSLDAMHWVRKYSRSKGAARLILMGIADATPGPDCIAWASYPYLMEWVGSTRPSTIADALKLLFTSGELKVVEGRKGPYGSTCYQLPLAIGHERPRRNPSGDRSDSGIPDPSGHRSDPTGNHSSHRRDPPKAIPPVTGVPPLRSPEGSEPQSLRSPEDRTMYVPKTTTSSRPAPEDAHAAENDGGGGHQDKNNNHGPAITLVATLDYLGQWPSDHERNQLVNSAHTALAAGWTPDDLRKQLDLRGGSGITSAVAVYTSRLARLPAPPSDATKQQAALRIPDWCGECNRGEHPTYVSERTREDHLGRPGKCHCHPGYKPTATAA